jgi:hypothetical protein
MGKILADAQERLASHNGGSFQQWVRDDTHWSLSMAYRLMNVYRAFGRSNLERLDLGASALYLLSEPSAPLSAREEALQRAENGETISHARAREIVEQHIPPRPPLPPLPAKPESPEYRVFEREELLPQLHDAGVEDAPQMLSGRQEEMQRVPEEIREQGRSGLRESIAEVLRGLETEDEEALTECADTIVGMLRQNGTIAISARVGAELQKGPRTLSDLVSLAAWVCDVQLDSKDRDTYLAWRHRVLRLIDAITSGGGLPIYEHQLANRQICYSLIEDPPDCP